jgi:carboxyl-terminal processing protease
MEIQNGRGHQLIKLLMSGFCIGLIMISGACKKDNVKKEYPQGSNEQINTWILDSLNRYYYWADELPKKPDLGQLPTSFFNSVRNGSDRFSQLYLPNQAGAPSSRSLYGFDYAVIQEPLSQEVFGLIKCVLKGSPAERYGLKRGAYIRKINGKTFSNSNVAALDQELLTGRTTKLTLTELKEGVYTDQPELNMIAGLTFDQPPVHQVIEWGGKKIGYVYIDGFSAGMASTLIPVFSGFKSAGVSELVIDLRYNSGGEVSEAAGLCAMIAPGLTYNTDFIIYKGNKNGGQRKESIGEAVTFDKRLDFNTALQNNLSLSRVFILATGATASAAEVMINNLKPFMKVKVIGGKTMGKDEASF